MSLQQQYNEIVYIVEDDAAVSDALSILMRTEGILSQTYSSAEAFLEQFHPEQAGCLILDVAMPGMSGMELQRRMQSLGYNIPIIFITGHGDIPMAVQAIQNGAIDFLQKPFRNDDLLKRIDAAFVRLRNNTRNNARNNTTNTHESQSVDKQTIKSLTGRELEVLDCIVEGLSNKAAAKKLNISDRTVETHRANIMLKLQARSVAELVKVAMASTDTV